MEVADIAGAIIEALTSGLTGIVTAVPQAISNSFVALFMTGSGETQSLSPFAVVMLVFGGITLAFGITKLIYNVVTSHTGG